MRHGLSNSFEIKWSKVSPAKKELSISTYWITFLTMTICTFGALVIPDKTRLRHGDFGHDHDTFYYKMFFTFAEGSVRSDIIGTEPTSILRTLVAVLRFRNCKYVFVKPHAFVNIIEESNCLVT